MMAQNPRVTQQRELDVGVYSQSENDRRNSIPLVAFEFFPQPPGVFSPKADKLDNQAV
jgi:hypothetical protein